MIEDSSRARLAGGWGIAAVAGLAIAASSSGLRNGFPYDDESLVANDARVHALGDAWRFFGTSYWPESLGGGAYRPLAQIGFALQWAIGGGEAWVFHLVSTLLYAAVCALVLLLARRLLPSIPAFAAAVLFAVHPIHVEPVAMVVGQGELLVALATLGAVLMYLRAREREGVPGVRDIGALAAIFLAACLTKEHAFFLPLHLLLAEWLLVSDRRGGVARRRALLPLAAALVAAGGVALLARAAVLGSGAGIAPWVPYSVLDVGWGGRVLTAVASLSEWVRLLWWPAQLAVEYGPPQHPIARGLDASALLGLTILATGTVVAVYSRRRAPVVTFALGWIAIGFLPVSNLLAPGGLLLGDRTLFLPSVGAMLLAGAALAAVTAHAPAPVTRVVPIAVALLVVAGAWRSVIRYPVWRDTTTAWLQAAKDAPHSYRARYLAGRAHFARGDRAEGERELRTAIQLFPGDPEVATWLGRQYAESGLCAPAIVLYRDVLARRPWIAETRERLVRCLLDEGRWTEARREASEAIAYGAPRETLAPLLAAADSGLARRVDSASETRP